MIAQQKDGIAEQRRRARVPPVDIEGRDFLTEMPLPDSLAVHVERDDLPRAEPGVHHLPVRHGAGARQVVLVVDAGQRSGRFQPVLPQPLAVAAAEGLDDEERAIVGRPTLSGSERPLADCPGSLRESWMIAGPPNPGADLRRDEDAIAGHDRRRHANAAERRTPGDVLGRAPGDRQVLLVGRTGAAWSAPLRPVSGRQRCGQSDREQTAEGAGLHAESVMRLRGPAEAGHYVPIATLIRALVEL